MEELGFRRVLATSATKMEAKEGKTMSLIEELRKRDTFLTTKEVMTLLNKRRNTICDWVRAGRLSAIRAGNEYLFDPRILAEWLAARTTARTLPKNSA
jgi:excisionase family DNA binding protein